VSRKHIFAILAAGAAGLAGVAIGVSAAVNHGSPTPPTKEQYAQALASQLASDVARHTPAPKVSPTPHMGPTPTAAPRQEGILDIRQGPVPPTVFASSNLWQGPLAGDLWYLVYAGQNMNPDGTRGLPAVIVQTTTTSADGASTSLNSSNTYTDSAADGAFTITAVSGAVMTLTTPLGQTVTFNLQTRQFQ